MESLAISNSRHRNHKGSYLEEGLGHLLINIAFQCPLEDYLRRQGSNQCKYNARVLYTKGSVQNAPSILSVFILIPLETTFLYAVCC